MTPEEKNPKVHHQTVRGARLAIARKEISQESYRGVLAGELSLEEAKSLGRNVGPSGPAVRVNKHDRSRPCIACGGLTKDSRFHPGCDARMHRIAREYVRGERQLSPEQLEYVTESGKLERAKARVAEEDRKRREKEAKK